MFCFFAKKGLGTAMVVLAVLAMASGASAQGADGYRNARRLGGSTSFYKPPLTTAASLKKMATNKRVAADLANVLNQGGVGDVADKIMSTLTSPTEVVKGASCAEATPADGTLVECDFQPGGTLQWMAFKPLVKGKHTPSLLQNLRWAGKKPFKAFLFRVTTDDKIYTFIVPKPCANISLASTVDVPKPPVQISVDRACTPDGKLTVTVKATGDLARVGRVRVSVNGSPAGELTAPTWSMTSDKPGTYTFEASDKNGKSYPVARTSATVEACPLPAPPQVVNPTCAVSVTAVKVKGGYELSIDGSKSSTGTSEIPATVAVEVYDPAGKMVGPRMTLDQMGMGKVTVPRKPEGTYSVKAFTSVSRPGVVGNKEYKGEATCETLINPANYVKTLPGASTDVPYFFVDAAVGKERRERPNSEKYDDPAALGLSPSALFGQCTPLLGLKVGYAKPLQNNWEVAGAVGVAIPLTSGDDKVKKTQLFVDVEANKYLNNGSFIGTGLSLWDITRGETFTPGWLVHFGVPLNKGSKTPVYFLGEGRLFFDNIDSADNNYQAWAGIRIHFPTR